MNRRLPPSAAGILGYFTRHRTLANLLLVLMLAAGAFAVPNMRAQFFPDVIIDNVSVSVSWDGAGAEDVDAGIVQLLEPALLVVDGVESTSSTSREGSARITLEFEPGWDMARAADDVQTAVDAITNLPEEAEEPEVRRGAWRDRVTDVVISGPVGVDQLGRFADEFVARLFAEGVTRTTIRGIAAPEVVVEVETVDLIRHDLSLAEIAAAIGAEAEARPAGDVTGANARVRTGVAKRSPDQIEAIALRSNPDGSTLTVGDVARIRAEGIDRERAYFVGENAAISVRVDRSDQGDAIGIQAQVQAVAEEMTLGLPEGVKIELIRTRAEYITARLDILMDNGLVGLGLVVTLLFLFLNARTAFWVAAGIPVAMCAAVALMYVSGLTINMISLFALIITLGIVVDDAIVVGEHADFRARELGEPPVVAAENAAKRMAMPVFSATLTTVIAFFGLTAISGRFGDLIADIPFTVIVVLIASLVECFLILPNHMSHAIQTNEGRRFSLLKLAAALGLTVIFVSGVSVTIWYLILPVVGQGAPWPGLGLTLIPVALTGLAVAGAVFLVLPRWHKARIVAVMGQTGFDLPSSIVGRGFRWVRDTLFRPLMVGVIWARYPVLALVTLILLSQAALFVRGDVTWRFFNAPERGSVTGNFAMLNGASREDTLVMMRELQRATEALGQKYEDEFGRNPVDFAMAEIGGTTGRGLAGADTKDSDLLGSIAIELIDADLRPYSSFRFVGELQDTVQRHPRLETISFRGWRSGPGGDSLSVQFSGASADTLKAAAEALKTAVSQYGEVSAVQDSLAYDKEELILDLTAQGQALGFDIEGLGRVLRNRLNGIEAANFPDGLRTARIRVELPAGELTADFLDRTQLRAPSGEWVPLADVVTVESRTGFSTVTRENGLRLIEVTGDISEDDPQRANEIIEELRASILPEIEERFGVASQLGGLAEQERDFLTDAGIGFGLCLLGIYLTLSWVFSSWTRPIVVMAIIPFGLVGTIYGHALWDVPLSMFTVIGLIGMTGIIINDSIVLVTTVDQYAEERGLFPAIVDGAADRLRPVLLTTLTTVLGLAPLLYETSQQAQFLKPTVITLCYGLGFGMFLVLLVVPALIAMQSDVARAMATLRRAVRLRRGARLASGIVTLGVLGTVMIFAATLGVQIVTGAPWAPLADLLPGDRPAAILLAFLGASAAMLVTIWVIGALVLGIVGLLSRRRRTDQAPVQP